MKNKVYVIQDIPGTREGRPKINIIGAREFGDLKVLLPENAQIILSAGPLVFKLRKLLKDYTEKDYILLNINILLETCLRPIVIQGLQSNRISTCFVPQKFNSISCYNK